MNTKKKKKQTEWNGLTKNFVLLDVRNQLETFVSLTRCMLVVMYCTLTINIDLSFNAS